MQSRLKEVQDEIDGTLVARMIREFSVEFRDVYVRDVFESNLCAVGPLQAMIGLAIKNGHLSPGRALAREGK